MLSKTSPRRGVPIIVAVMAVFATLFAVLPTSIASASNQGFACFSAGGEITISAPGQTTVNILRKGSWIKQVSGANLDDNAVDYTDGGYTDGDSYSVVLWIKGVRNVVPCAIGTGSNPPPPPPSLEAVCTVENGGITVKSNAGSFNLRKNGRWIATVTSDLSDMEVDFRDQSFQAGDVYEVVVRKAGQRVDAACTDTTPAPSDPGIDLMKFVEGDDANNAPGPEFESGQTVEFSYKVTNTGDTALNNVKVTDDTLGDITCPANQLDIGESFTCTISKQLAEGPAAVFMEAEATATSPQGDDVSDTDPINLSISAMPPPPPTNCGVLPWTMDLRIYGSDAERHALYAPGEETPFLIVTRNPDWFPSTDRWGSKYYFYQTPGIPTGLMDVLEVAALGETGEPSTRIRCFRI